MKTAKITLWALLYHVIIILSVVWYGVRCAVLLVAACACVAAIARLIEKDEPEDDLESGSCEGCKNNLGGGHCRINVEGECREGGGFELWEKDVGKPPKGSNGVDG